MRRTFAALALALLLTTAGCNALGGGSGTPTDAPSDAAIPGVEDGRVANETDLLVAHQKTIVNAGFETNVQVNATGERRTRNGTETVAVERTQRTTVTRGATGYTIRLVNAGSGAQFDEWANRTVRATRLQAGGQTQYRAGAPRRPNQLVGTAFLRPYVDDNMTVESREETDGGTLVTFTSTTPPIGQSAFPANATDVRDYEATLVVDEEGRIHSLEVTAAYTISGEEAELRVVYDLERVGVESVERPDWVENATQQ